MKSEDDHGSVHALRRELSEKGCDRQNDNLPWNKKRPTILEARPREPTMTTRRGLDISVKVLVSSGKKKQLT